MANERYVLEVQIRQNSDDVTTDDPGSVANVTVVKDTFDDEMDLSRMSHVRAYLDDDHDEAIDVDIRHTHVADDDYSGENTNSTVSLTSGADQGTVALTGPLGRLRAVIKASGAAAAPTTGSMTIEVLATS